MRAPVLDPPTAGSASRPLVRGLRWLTLPRLWLVVALGGIAAMQLAVTPSSIDLAYHVRAGALMVHDHALLRTDVFAWPTAGQRWLDQNWGAQVLLYGLWRLGGFSLIAVVNAAVTTASWGLVAAACRRRTDNLRVIAGAILTGFAGSLFIFSARPQMFSVLLFALELYLLEVARERPRVLLALPPLMAVWASLHGAFLLGLGLVGAELVAAAWPARERDGDGKGRLRLGDAVALRRFALLLVASVVALCANPWGPRVLGYAVGLVANPSIRGGVVEWAPATLRDDAGAGLFGGIAVLVVALARAGIPERARVHALRVVPLTVLALWTIRGSVWWGLTVPLLLCTVARVRPRRPAADQGSPLPTAMVLATVVLAIAVAAPPTRHLLAPPTRQAPTLGDAPVAAAEWLAAHPQPGRMFNFQPWGSYLEFRLGPAVQPAVDSRIELFSAHLWDDYASIAAGRYDALRLLDGYHAQYVVADAKQTPNLVAALSASGDWYLAFSDRRERVFVRR